MPELPMMLFDAVLHRQMEGEVMMVGGMIGTVHQGWSLAAAARACSVAHHTGIVVNGFTAARIRYIVIPGQKQVLSALFRIWLAARDQKQ